MLSYALAERGAEVVVSVATDYGSETQGSAPGISTHVGPMTPEEKQAFLQGAALCVDATHPYATHVTASIRAACESCGCPCIRLLRQESELTEGVTLFDSAREAADFLARTDGNVLLTTGARELDAFSGLDPARLYPRVLPSHASLSACEALHIPRRNIIAMQGPFSRELNEALIRQYAIRYVLSKDGGAPGGFPEKAAAARETGAQLIVIRRPADEGLPFDGVLNLCTTRLRAANKVSEQGETT